MKLFYKATLSVMLAGTVASGAMAQAQLPNSSFEDSWADCTPWTFFQSEGYVGQQSTFAVGTTPKGWIISNVAGMASCYTDDENNLQVSGLGATTVGEKAEGYESETAVKLTNNPNPFMATQIVPGYLTLGTSWSTAKPTFQGWSIVVTESDGGAFGGMEFTERPSGIEFMYKRSRGETKPDEKSTVVAYLWKGHWTQKDVPAIVYMAGDPVVKDMTDRDRCVLGMDLEGCQGGEVTKSDDAELIAVMIAEITENTDEWTKFTGKFEYKSDATPEMINVIIAAGDYFGGAEAVGKDNSLTVDNVNLLYENSASTYPGYLNVEMMGNKIATDQASKIEITATSDNTCDFLLPNLVISTGGQDMALGDIKLDNVAMSTANGVTTYTGSQKGMSLMGGIITADVDLNGTINADGIVNMKIDVMWGETPINVTFTTKPASESTTIDSINADSNAPVEYFNIQGLRVSENNFTPGLYIKRQGQNVKKILVK
ncbi:MAG: PCMD domain-containing protein [Staphylococcus sp.]|nr:PCMD domain-containing protein [Staphylococcus sp.]